MGLIVGFEERILAQLCGFYMLAYAKLVTEHSGISFFIFFFWDDGNMRDDILIEKMLL